MGEINQPIAGELDTSPPKTTTQHSHTSGFDHEANLNEEDQDGVNQYTMMVEEEVQDGDNPGDDSPNIEGTIDPQQEGNDSEDTVIEEEEEGNQTPLNIGDDDGGFEKEDKNDEGDQDIGEGQTQGQTLANPNIAAIP